MFIDEETDFSGYRRVLLEPVVAWAPGGSPLAVIPEPERKQLAGYFDAALRRELALEFELVEETGPGTLRMRAAVTRARESDDPSDVESSIEVEVLDAVTGQRLLAAVATRSEDEPQPGSAETGSGVHRSFDYWAEVIRKRLAAFRAVEAALAEGRVPIP